MISNIQRGLERSLSLLKWKRSRRLVAGETLGTHNNELADQRNGHQDKDRRLRFERVFGHEEKDPQSRQTCRIPFFETNNSIKYLDKHLK